MPIASRYGGSGASSGFASRYKPKSSSNIDYEQLAQSIGIDPNKDKNKKSFLDSIFDIIGRPQQAIFGGISAAESGQNPLEGAWKGLSGQTHDSFGDILKKGGMGNQDLFTIPFLNKKVGTRDIAGLAGDLVLDPLNLVGVGEAADAIKGFKLADEAVTLGKAGREALTAEKAAHAADAAKAGINLTGDALDQAARKSLADKMVANPSLVNKYVDKGGIKLAGKSVIPQKTITNTADALEKVPVVNIPVKTARGAKNVADHTFDLFHQGFTAKKAPGGEQTVNILTMHKNALSDAANTASNVEKAFADTVNKAKPKDMSLEDALQMVRQYVEKPSPNAPDWIKPHIQAFQEATDKMRAAEADVFKAAGRDNAFIEDYYPRMFRNPPEQVKTVVDTLNEERLKNPLNIKAGFTKERQLPGLTIDDIVNKGKEMGFDLQPLNAAEALGARTRSGLMATAKLDTANRLKAIGAPPATEAVAKTSDQVGAVQGAIKNEQDAARTAAMAEQAPITARQVGKGIERTKRQLDDAVIANRPQEEITALRQKISDLNQNYAHLKEIASRGRPVKNAAKPPEDMVDLFSTSKKAANPVDNELFSGMPQKAADNNMQAAKQAKQQQFFDEAAKNGTEGISEAKAAADTIAKQTNIEGKGYVSIPDIKELDGFRFPPVVAQYIHKELTSAPRPKGDVMKALDSFAALWKGSVTTLPTSAVAFNLRNKIGNMFNMYLGGIDNPAAMKEAVQTSADVMRQLRPGYKGVKQVTDKFGENYTFDYLRKIGVMSGQVEKEVGKVAQGMGGKAVQAGSKAADMVFKPGQKLGEFVESPDRVAMFIHARNSGKSVPESVAYVNKYLFDYANPTKTVKAVGRAIPFFTWTANNLPLQVEKLIKTPGKYSHLRALYQNGITPEDRQNLPGYVNEGMTLNGGKKTDAQGNEIQTVLTNLGLPAEDLGRLDRGGIARTVEREILGAPLPIIQEPLEEATGRDFFRGKDLKDLATTYGFAARNYPEELKKLIGYKETPYTDKNGNQKISYSVDPVLYKRYTDLLPISRLLGTLFPSGAQGSTKDKIISSIEKGVAPVSVQDYNLTQGASNNQKAAMQALQDKLVAAGKLAEYSNYYIPKDQQQKISGGKLASSIKSRYHR